MLGLGGAARAPILDRRDWYTRTVARHRLHHAALAAAVHALVAGSAGCSFLLGFDDPEPAQDAAAADAASPLLGDAGPDLYEPNDTPATAVGLEPGVYGSSIAPEGDEDYWQLVLAAESDVVIGLRFTDTADLDLDQARLAPDLADHRPVLHAD